MTTDRTITALRIAGTVFAGACFVIAFFDDELAGHLLWVVLGWVAVMLLIDLIRWGPISTRLRRFGGPS